MLGDRGRCSVRVVVTAILVILCVVMTSCATTAQRQGAARSQGIQVVRQNWKSCTDKITSNPTYWTLFQHRPFSANKATLAQLADTGVPSDEDVDLIIAFHNEMANCRAQFVENAMQVDPGVVPIYTESWHKADLLMVDLIQKKITWGESNKQRIASGVKP
jgi:hypothetical protein